VKIGAVKATFLYVISTFTFRWVKLGTGYLHIMLFSAGEFHKTRRKKGLTFVTGQIKLHLRVHRETMWHSESKDHLRKSELHVMKNSIYNPVSLNETQTIMLTMKATQ
jgi:hypothetical protein